MGRGSVEVVVSMSTCVEKPDPTEWNSEFYCGI